MFILRVIFTEKMNKTFSIFNRPSQIASLSDTVFDLVIIGGGITGAGIALDASSRGLKCLLLEKQDFAAGTSSRSTKLIHGGLRYLKQLEVGLVREVGKERAVIHENAPHIVVPKKMILPIIEEGSLGKYSTSMGLYVYDMLAGVDKEERRTMHDKETIAEMEPLLRTDILLGGGLYYEYQTDDSRLTIEVLKTANELGAISLNYAEVTDFIYEKGKIKGIKAIDRLAGEAFEARGKIIVNACGPWVDILRKKDSLIKGKKLHLTKGVHIVVPYERLPLQQAAYFDVQDGRMIFAIPKKDITYIGTTDTNYHDNKERPAVRLSDVEYILSAVNNMFPACGLSVDDVLSSWCGLRPLIHEEGKDPSELSRKDEIFVSKSGLISIAGGKLTGFRKMAERTVDEVEKDLFQLEKRPIEGCNTENLKLSGGNFKHPDIIPYYTKQLYKKYKGRYRNYQKTSGKPTWKIRQQHPSNFGFIKRKLFYRKPKHRTKIIACRITLRHSP